MKDFYESFSEATMWNWQMDRWPEFTWDTETVNSYQNEFWGAVGEIKAAALHFDSEDKEEFIVQLLTIDAQETALIEGQTLDRISVQSSIRKHLGLNYEFKKSKAAESGIAVFV